MSPPAEVVGCVLAGGRARRFGSFKPLASWYEGRTLVEAVIASLRAVTSHTMVVGKDLDQLGFLADRGVSLVRDQTDDHHPATGLMTAIAATPSPWLLVVACDTPLVRPSLLAALAGQRAGDVVLPVWEGHAQPFPGLYSRRIRPRLTQAVALHQSMKSLCADLCVVQMPETSVRRLDPEGLSFADADTPEALAALMARVAAPHPSHSTSSPTAISPPGNPAKGRVFTANR